MLGILILIALSLLFWRQYAELAHEYDRNRTGFGFLGVGIYLVAYLVAAVVGVLLAFGSAAAGNVSDAVMTGLLIEGCCIGFASLVAWLVRLQLKKAWEAAGRSREDSDLLDRQ